jgi:hypothetical protein
MRVIKELALAEPLVDSVNPDQVTHEAPPPNAAGAPPACAPSRRIKLDLGPTHRGR